MKIKSELLQKIVSKVIQGSSNNKMLPVTSLVGIDYKDSYLTLITTDGTTQFRVKQKLDVPNEEDYEFYTIVNAEQFAKLVGKTTKEFIELDNKDNYLEFKGNGTYKLDIAVNEEGQMIKFNEVKIDEEDTQVINLQDLQEAIKTAKASLAKTMELPCLTGYYIGEDVITTDRQLVCKLRKKLVQQPILLPSQMADLLLLVELGENDIFKLFKTDNQLIFISNKYVISGKELEGKEMYGGNIAKAINNLTQLSYTSNVIVNKTELLNILDRMEIFVSDYDKNGVYLRFKKDAKVLEVQSVKSNAVEQLQLNETDVINDFNCFISIEMLKAQLQSLVSDNVQIQYGDQKSIQLVEGNTTLVVALLDEDN